MGDTTDTKDEEAENKGDPPQPKPEEKGGKDEEDVIETADQLGDDDPITKPEPKPEPQPEGKKILKIRSDAMKEIKSKAREAGKREAEKAIADQLSEFGYESLADMAKEIKTLKEGAAKGAAEKEEKEEMATKKDEKQPDDQAGKSDEEMAKLRSEREAAIEKTRKTNRARAREEKRRRQAQRELDAEREERKLERIALQSGVVDVDYALTCLRRDLKDLRKEGKEEELKAFDVKKYFAETLKDRRPHLYKVVERKADTSGANDTAKNETGDPPNANGKKPDGNGGGDDQIDAMAKGKDGKFATSPEEFQALLRKKGLSVPNAGF